MSTHFNITNPFSQELLYKVAWMSDKEIQNKVENLTNNSKKSTIQDKVTILEKLSFLLDKNQNELSILIATETGKPVTDGILEIQRASTLCKSVAHELSSLKGEVYTSTSCYYENLVPQEKFCLTKRFPYGVVLAIVPFNFPVNLAIHKIAPAFAMGNTIIVKPHPQCYETTKFLISICHKSGMNKNDIEWIYPNNDQTQKLIAHEKIDLISFTGGTSTAKTISTFAGIKKTLFELGGNDALVVYPDADIKKVTSTIISQRFRCAGQRCTSPKRIFIHSSIKESVINQLLFDLKNFKIGDPLEKNTDMGPVINLESKKIIISKIESSLSKGAKLLLPLKVEGNIISPILLDNINLTMPVVSDETFGPVASFITFSNDEEVIDLINQSSLGLQCGVFSENISLIKKFFSCVKVGSIIANEGPAYRMDHFPFGGFKDSGTGREGSFSALLEYSCSKNLII